MAKTHEKINLTSPRAIAVEIAVGGLIAWKYRARLLRQYDSPEQPEPPPTPVSEVVGESPVYVMQTGENGFEIGMKHPEVGFIGISGTTGTDERGGSRVEIDEATSESDPEKLRLLLQNVRTVRRRWAHKQKF